MPVHDWSKVDAGIFHTFHCSWITHLMGSMNRGVLPADHYALIEQHAGLSPPDVMTRRRTDPGIEASSKPSYSPLRRTLAVRRTPGDRLVAIVEFVSPENDDLLDEKARAAVASGIHLLRIDLFKSWRHELSDEVPLFIDPQAQILLPLDTTYAAAFREMPSVYQKILS